MSNTLEDLQAAITKSDHCWVKMIREEQAQNGQLAIACNNALDGMLDGMYKQHRQPNGSEANVIAELIAGGAQIKGRDPQVSRMLHGIAASHHVMARG